MPSVFFAGGDIACRQAQRAVPSIVTVQAKREIARNQAEFRDNEALFAEIGSKIVEAVRGDAAPCALSYPAVVEKSFKRVEDAARCLLKLRGFGISADHPNDEILGKDGHTVTVTVYDVDQFIKCI